MHIKRIALIIVALGSSMVMNTASAFSLTSSAFEHNGQIPTKYTCDGENKAPEFSWSGVPEGTQTCALIIDDPDAPAKVWVHWVVYNVPVSVRSLSVSNSAQFSAGLNDFGNTTYGGPCPPNGMHRYHCTLYAVDTKLSFADTPTKKQLLSGMEGHVLGKTTLIGTYTRKK